MDTLMKYCGFCGKKKCDAHAFNPNSVDRGFEFVAYEDEESDVAFNRSNIYDFKRNDVSFYLDALQDSPNGRKGLSEIARMHWRLLFDDDENMSGVINDCIVTLEGYDGEKQTFTIDEIDPEQLFWIGKLFTKIATHFGVDDKQQRQLNDESVNRTK